MNFFLIFFMLSHFYVYNNSMLQGYAYIGLEQRIFFTRVVCVFFFFYTIHEVLKVIQENS